MGAESGGGVEDDQRLRRACSPVRRSIAGMVMRMTPQTRAASPARRNDVELGESELGCLVRVAVEGEEHGELTSADARRSMWTRQCRRARRLGGTTGSLRAVRARGSVKPCASWAIDSTDGLLMSPASLSASPARSMPSLHPTVQRGVDSAVSEHVAQPIRIAGDSSALDLLIAVAEPGEYVTLEVGAVGQHVVEPSALDAAGGLGGETLSGVFLSGVEGSCDAGGPSSDGVEGGSQLDRLSRHRQGGLRPCAELEELPPLGVVVQGGDQSPGVSGNVAGNGMLVGCAQVGQVDRDP